MYHIPPCQSIAFKESTTQATTSIHRTVIVHSNHTLLSLLYSHYMARGKICCCNKLYRLFCFVLDRIWHQVGASALFVVLPNRYGSHSGIPPPKSAPADHDFSRDRALDIVSHRLVRLFPSSFVAVRREEVSHRRLLHEAKTLHSSQVCWIFPKEEDPATVVFPARARL